MTVSRVAVVTGAASGIGTGIAERLAGDGMAVALVHVQPEVHAVGAGIRANGGTDMNIVADPTVPAGAEMVIERVERGLGPVWLFVNSAGIYSAAPVLELSEAGWVAPGMTRSPMLDAVLGPSHDLPGAVALIPAGRLAEPADHAAIVAWLASDEAGHVTGQVISVDGGQSLLHPFLPPPKTAAARRRRS